MTPNVANNLKTIIGYALYATPWPRFVFRNKYLITAFHRVNDTTVGDGITCAPENFRRICKWMAKKFRVVPLSEQIEAIERGKILSNTASITFDDGYLDNYEIAAPILRELRLPATFFVSTDLLDSDFVPAWDAQAGIATRWMTWSHVRGLAKQGFDVESHTCTHIDLGTADHESAQAELSGSLAKLNSVLGKRQRMFAYPFGGMHNITDSTRQLVRDATYRCCLSCHGGINTTTTSPFSLCRMPVNEEYHSAEQFGLELLRTSIADTHGLGNVGEVHTRFT
jgi:peptidoglycan/xylan/chitin deacetylase (PgdA/CDA1 family)